MACYLKLFVDVRERYQKLSDAEFGRLIRAALTYKAEGVEVKLQGREELMWDGMKLDIDRDNERQKSVNESRAEAGRKGAESRWQKDGKNSKCHLPYSKNGYDKDKEEDKDKEKNNHPIVPRDFYDLSGLCVTDNARAAQEEVANWLEERGYSCTLEVPVADRGDGRSGRIDLLAERDGVQVAIEVDRDSPREKSLFKLRQFSCAKVILVRNGAEKESESTTDGIKIIYMTCNQGDVFEAFAGGNKELLDALREFETMRKAIKKPMTDLAKKKLVGKLKEFAEPYHAKQRYMVECLHESILNDWQSVYELKDFQDSEPYRPPVVMNWVVPNPDSDNWEDLVP